MKNRKATGHDELNVKLFKYGGLVLEFSLSHLLNEFWKQGDVPHSWRSSDVVPIFKNDTRNDCKNYEANSLLNCRYKISSRIISKHLSKMVLGDGKHVAITSLLLND